MSTITISPYSDDADQRLRWGLVMLLTLAAAGLRLAGLGHDSIWIDEFFTWRMVNPGPGHGFWEQLLDNHQNPQYMALVWPLIRDHFSEFLMRLPAFVAGVLAIPLIARVGRDLGNARTGEWAALLLAINPYHIWYSQEARGYTLAIFWTLAATIFLLQMYAQGFRRRDAVAFGLCGGLAVLGNMSSLLLLGAQGITTLFMLRGRGHAARVSAALAAGVLLLVVSPWLLQVSGVLAFDRMVPGAATGVALRGETTFTPLVYPYTFFTMIYGFSLGPSSAQLHWPDRVQLIRQAWPLLSVAGALAILLLIHGFRRSRNRWLLSIWFLLPIMLLTGLALRNVKTFTPRYLAVLLPVLLVTAAAGAVDLKRLAGRVVGGAFIAVTILSLFNYYTNDHYGKPDMRRAAAIVDLHDRDGEAVLVPVVHRIFKLYYPHDELVVDFNGFEPVRSREAAADMMRQRMAGLDQGWLVLNSTWVLDPNNHWPSLLPELAEIEEEYDLPNLKIYHWRRPGLDPARED